MELLSSLFDPESFEEDLDPSLLELGSSLLELASLLELDSVLLELVLLEPELSELELSELELSLLELESSLFEPEPLSDDVAFESDLVNEPPDEIESPVDFESSAELVVDSAFGVALESFEELLVSAAAEPAIEPGVLDEPEPPVDPEPSSSELAPPSKEPDPPEEPDVLDELEPPTRDPVTLPSVEDGVLLGVLSAAVIGAVRALSADPAGAESWPDPVTACVAPPSALDRAPPVSEAVWATAATGSEEAGDAATVGAAATVGLLDEAPVRPPNRPPSVLLAVPASVFVTAPTVSPTVLTVGPTTEFVAAWSAVAVDPTTSEPVWAMPPAVPAA